MKVILDIDELRQAGEIDDAEYEKLKRLSKRSTGAFAFSLLVGFGVIAVCASVLVILPTPEAVIGVGLALAVLGFLVQQKFSEEWALFGNMCLVVGAFVFGGGAITLGEGSVASFLLVAVALAGAGIAARNALLIAGSVLALASCIGVRTGYFHATYFLGIQEPTLTIVLFALVALGTFQLSKRLAPEYERLAIVAARVSVFLVNFGFWIGSLWGDRLEQLKKLGVVGEQLMIPRGWFGVLWALALIGVALWAVRANRRWVVNVAAVFGAIHFYTQWFERLGADPFTVLAAGLVALGLALALWHFNKRLFAHAAGPA